MEINYINGKYKNATESCLNIYDIGFLRGYGVFDFIRTYNKVPFLLDEHLTRLQNSVRETGLNPVYTVDMIKGIILKLIKLNNFKELTFRVILTGGISRDAMSIDQENTNLYVIVSELHPVSKDLYAKGVKLITKEYQHRYAKAKTLDYLNLLENQNLLKDQDAFTILYHNDGKVLEAAISNVFIIKDNIIITPKRNILIGTTRNYVIDLLKDNCKVEQRDTNLEEMWEADEIFITGTTQGVLPVTQVDGNLISGGLPGEITKNIVDTFNNSIKNNDK